MNDNIEQTSTLHIHSQLRQAKSQGGTKAMQYSTGHF